MPVVVRTVAMLVLLVVVSFCLFGFWATFEPLDRTTQWTWRIIYSAVGAASLSLLVWLARSRR